MRRYETIVIIDADLSDEGRHSILERLKDIISKEDGLLILIDDWGKKRLAYEVRKKTSGYYIRLDYCGMGSTVSEIERFFRIDDRIYKYMTILLEKDVDIEDIKQQIADAESEDDASKESSLPDDDSVDSESDDDSSKPVENLDSETVKDEATQTEISKEEQ